jgi:hypothetical protein
MPAGRAKHITGQGKTNHRASQIRKKHEGSIPLNRWKSSLPRTPSSKGVQVTLLTPHDTCSHYRPVPTICWSAIHHSKACVFLSRVLCIGGCREKLPVSDHQLRDQPRCTTTREGLSEDLERDKEKRCN